MNDERKTSFEHELLDRAFEHQRLEEPRPGLEGRVLARLETAAEPSRNRVLKTVAVAVPAVLVSVLAVYVLRSPATRPPTAVPEPARVAEAAPALIPAPPPPIVKEKSPAAPPRMEAAASRAPTFPSLGELSPQEALLVRFVRSAPIETLRAVAEGPSTEPLQIEELSTPRLHVEPLRTPDPLSAS